jgi:hypothetical protein
MGLYCSIVVRNPGKKQSPCRHMNFVPHRKRLNKKVKEMKRKEKKGPFTTRHN